MVQPRPTGSGIALLESFRCSGDACVDTCCRGWDMQVDPPHLELYRARRPDLAQAVDASGPQPVMRRAGTDATCVKLAGGLCSVHAELGPSFLGDACHFYPRVVRRMGEAPRMAVTLSCPEAARLALFGVAPFARRPLAFDRLPCSTRDVAPAGLAAEGAAAVVDAFVALATEPSTHPDRAVRLIVSVARSLGRREPGTWPDALGLLVKLAPAGLCATEADDEDPVRLLHALAGLIRATRHRIGDRLRRTLDEIEAALAVRIDPDSLDIWGGPERQAALDRLLAARSDHGSSLADTLRRWLAAQILAADFPFAGLGSTPSERATILAVRYATLRLALAARVAGGGALDETVIVRIVQSLSRFLDHLAEPALSLALYGDAGWTREPRLGGLVEGGRQELPGSPCRIRQDLPGDTVPLTV